MISRYEDKQNFFNALSKLTQEMPSLDKISELVRDNQHFLKEPADQKAVRKILSPLKAQLTQSRNNPIYRSLVFQIMHLAGSSKTIQSHEPRGWKDMGESQWEIAQFRKALLRDKDFTDNFEFVAVEGNTCNFLGRGREGIVYLAKAPMVN